MGDRVDAAFKTTGSKLLLPVSEFFGFPLDQVGICFYFSFASNKSVENFLLPSCFCKNAVILSQLCFRSLLLPTTSASGLLLILNCDNLSGTRPWI